MTYRVGRHNPRNIYRGDEHVGVMFSPADGPIVVAALNAAAEPKQPTACTDCGRTARRLEPFFEDADIVAWLGPTCYRRRMAALEEAAHDGMVCQLITVPLGGAR